MIYFCATKNRRALVLQHPTLNGIDFLEVVPGGDGDCVCGTQLRLTLLHDARNQPLTLAQVQITGGGPKAQLQPLQLTAGSAAEPLVVIIDLNQTGDFSQYTLALVATPGQPDPPDGYDPQLSQVCFSFKAGCPTIGDWLPDQCCPPPAASEPDLNYLAKDYEGFRQVMLDRMATLTGNWTETHIPDLGVMLVEVLAYVADHLSYQQDAVGTEAYLGTARSRISLRRHARLVDYAPSEGCNARAWIFLGLPPQKPNDPPVSLVVPALTPVYPRVPGLPPVVNPNDPGARLLVQSAPAFSTMREITLHQEQNQMCFYTWNDSDCCLAPGSTQATLRKSLTTLKPGMVLIFKEVKGPRTGNSADADPGKRWPVLLTGVRTQDSAGRPLVDPLNQQLITRIQWAAADALPFPLCLSSTLNTPNGPLPLADVSVALGNIVPADQGLWLASPEDLGEVPPPPMSPVPQNSCSCGGSSPVDPARPRYYPQLAQSPLTFALPFDNSSVWAFSHPSPTATPLPQIKVTDDEQKPWDPLPDLLSSGAADAVFVLEIERDGTVFLRFGDDEYGRQPATGTSFQAEYRVGNGASGNVGRDTLSHVLTTLTGIVEVGNPLAATGGIDPETMEHIRQVAPFAFQSQLRAVTEDDYGQMAAQDPAIRQARGTFRWTGSWYTAFLSLDAVAENLPVDLVKKTGKRLNLLRMMGMDLAVEAARIVGLRITLEVCVADDFFQGDVEAAILELLVSGNRCNGLPGLLNAASFTFGQTIYTSPLIAAVQAVPGVAAVTLTVLQRMDDPSVDGAAQGFLTMGRLEIARCDNDPERLDHGIITLKMDGGK